jgi:hypothetical protein
MEGTELLMYELVQTSYHNQYNHYVFHVWNSVSKRLKNWTRRQLANGCMYSTILDGKDF